MIKYSDYEHYSETFSKDYMSYFDESKTSPSFNDIYSFKYLMIIAEPGYGKTRLFKELVLKADQNNSKVFFIDSKQIKNSIVESINKCKIVEQDISEEKLQKKIYFSNTQDYTLTENTIICLDALDEIPFSKLYSFFEEVEEFISDYPKTKVFLSCRTHHLKKVEYDLTNISFAYITLDSFYERQIVKYLENIGLCKTKIDEIKEKSHLTNLNSYLSIPRYLYYFSEITKNKSIKEVMSLSRTEIFEEFIYRKINKERDVQYPESENHSIKRVLEELALVMKLFQVSQISKDDFFTVFKELNLSNIFTGEGLIEKLTEKSLLKDNIDYLEFENQEFLDFLAAKELSRFEKVEQVFFDMAVEPHFKEVYASWFYVMPFVLEQHPQLINIILGFLEQNSDKILREAYFDVITSIDITQINKNTKSRIFNIVFDYYYEHRQPLYPNKLIYFYIEEEHYSKILHSINSDIDKVRRRNAIELIEEIANHYELSPSQINFWKETFLKWLKLEPKKHRHLHASLISSCAIIMKNDFNWIKDIYFIFENGIEVQHEYSRTCNKIAPNDEFSINVYLKCTRQFKKNQLERAGRLDDNIKYICNINNQSGLQYLLEKLVSKDYKIHLDYLFHGSTKDRFQNDLKILISNIRNYINKEIYYLLKKIILNLLIENMSYRREENQYLFQKLFQVLMKENPSYIYEFIDKIYCLYLSNKIYNFQLEDIIVYQLAKYFNIKNYLRIYGQLKQFNLRNFDDLIASRLYFNEKLDGDVKKKIEESYSKELSELLKSNKKYKEKSQRDDVNRQRGLCKQWGHKIEPEPRKFVTDLFYFYKNNKEALKHCKNFESNKIKTINLAKSVLLHNNPLDGKIKVNGRSSTIWGVHYYKEAIELLYNEHIELKQPEEQTLIDNIFRYLPFDINSEYESTLKLAYSPSTEAIKDILDVYSGVRDDDLDISHPRNLIEIYRNMRIIEADKLLLGMLYNSKISEYIREQIITILPKEILTQADIEGYIKTKGEKDELYESMLIALVKNFNNEVAIKKIFELVIKKGKETEIPDDASNLWDTSLDLDRTHNKLAHTLMKINYNLKEDKKLLEIALILRKNEKNLNALFFEEIVFGHLKHLNNKKSFEPLIEVEKFLQSKKLNSFEYKLKELKDIFLNEIAKPKHIMEAIKSYKKAKANEYLLITSPLHLMEIVKGSINNEIKNWIEIEGAYKHIQELSKKNTNTNAEDFIQKTLTPQIELALLKRGLRHTDIRIKREEQTLDDKRADFTISYGFVGQVLLELKLSHNPESKINFQQGKEYKSKLQKYIGATNSDYGIFVIFNIREHKTIFKNQIKDLAKYYNEEKNIFIQGIDCKIN